MSWHPYEPKRRLWNIYYQQRAAKTPGQSSIISPDIIQLEITEPYALNREQLADLHIAFMRKVTPPGYTINVSQLWTRMYPTDNAVIFGKLVDVGKIPVIISAECDRNVQPGKRRDYYWMISQLEQENPYYRELLYLQNIDLENITWITAQPLTPYPDQMYEHNRAAWAWNKEILKTADMDELVRRECWAFCTTDQSHLNFLVPVDRITPEELHTSLQELAQDFALELEWCDYKERPRKDGAITTMKKLPGNMWVTLKEYTSMRRNA